MENAASQLIKLYMDEQVLTGSIYYAPTPEARLLDALNGLSDMGPVKRGKFLELNDVTIVHADGRSEKISVSYINRSTVILAATLGGVNAGRGIGGRPGPKSYPYVDKSTVPVRLETQHYFIVGNMYRVDSQKVWYVLEDNQPFLPLTSAEIQNRDASTTELMPFLAVNKEHIISVHEENGQKRINFIKPK